MSTAAAILSARGPRPMMPRKKKKNPRRSCKHREDFDYVTAKAVGKESSEKSITITHAEKWRNNLRLLIEFKEERGHCIVPKNHPHRHLAEFVANLRNQYKNNTLKSERLKILRDLNFCFNVHNERWESKYRGLCEVLEEKERSGEELTLVRKVDKKLYKWVERQRQLYSRRMRNQTSCMTDDRIRRLTEIGIDLNPRNVSFSCGDQDVHKTDNNKLGQHGHKDGHNDHKTDDYKHNDEDDDRGDGGDNNDDYGEEGTTFTYHEEQPEEVFTEEASARADADGQAYAYEDSGNRRLPEETENESAATDHIRAENGFQYLTRTRHEACPQYSNEGGNHVTQFLIERGEATASYKNYFCV